jgi:lipid A 3-O-deacylase
MRLGWLAAAATVCVAALSGPAAAAEEGVAAWIYEVKAGLLYHDMDYLWSNFRLESGVDFNGEVIFAPKLDLLGGAFRGALGASINSDGGTSKAYLDLRYMYEFDSGPFFSVGGGGAVHNGNLTPSSDDRKALGSRLLFHIPIEVGYRFTQHQALSIYYDHVSNAYLAKYNQGLDTLGLRYGYRFRVPDGTGR